MNTLYFTPPIWGMISAIISCFVFIIFHQITISNIWFSSPFMLVISALSGYLLVLSYQSIIENYSLLSWTAYSSYYIVGLLLLSVLSVLIFTPEYSSEEILNLGGAPPSGLIRGALPLTIAWMLLSAIIVVYFVTKSFSALPIVLLTSAVIYLTLGLNISILGKVSISPQHQYLVQKFMAMNIMLGAVFFLFFAFFLHIFSVTVSN